MKKAWPFWRLVAPIGFGTIGLMLVPSLVSGQAGDAVTYARDVAPIMQQKCQTCHRPGSVAPMALLTYQDARRWASSIRQQVSQRIMPPWPLDHSIGVQSFKNDRSLSDEQISTIVSWVDAGAPMGDSADEPPAIDWPSWGDHWTYELSLIHI